MSATLALDGIVGWDITAADVRAALTAAGPEIALHINSPGGDVHEGVAIANALRQYRRDGGRVTGRITGIAASMASYIAMFADELEVEDNAIFMVHNPWSVAMGDYRTMEKAAGILAALRSLLARAYGRKRHHDEAAILADMDAESWYYGQEIVAAGYADALIPAGDGPESPGEALALAQAAHGAMRAKLKEREADAARLDQIAALLPPSAALSASPHLEKPMAEPDTVADNSPAAAPEPAATPDLESQVTEAVQAALVAERQRIAAITRACAAARLPDKAKAWIEEGISIDQARERLINALAEQGGPELRNAAAPAQPDDFQALVATKQAAGASRAQALRQAIAEQPALHRAWLAQINQ